MRLYPGSGSPISDAVVARYVAAERWSAAAEAMATYYVHRDDKGRWDLLRLKVQQRSAWKTGCWPPAGSWTRSFPR